LESRILWERSAAKIVSFRLTQRLRREGVPAERVSAFIERVKPVLGERCSTRFSDLVSYSRDYWPISLHWLLKGEVPSLPDAVVWPESTEEVALVVSAASSLGIPVYPYGGGSGVLGGAVPEMGGVVVDLKRMRSIRLYEEDFIVEAEAGVNGYYLESYLNHRGLTLGQIPQSLYPSTVGGWVATKATGQFSTKYGGIEDMVLGLEVVLPTGEIARFPPHPRSSTGPDLMRLFIGSEGALGIITRVWLRVQPYPEERILQSFVHESFEEALQAVRRVLARGAKPAVVRVYDRIETKRHFYAFEEAYGKVLTIVILEGSSEVVRAEAGILEREMGGKPLGEEPVRHWLRTRFDVREAPEFAPLGVVFDTIEVAAPWSRVVELYHRFKEAVGSVDEVLFVSAHASHFYLQGACLYFTFAGVPRGDPTEFYNRVWDAAMRATLECGGAISHHHGIGRQRRPWLRDALGGGYAVLARVKAALDPRGVMNPGWGA